MKHLRSATVLILSLLALAGCSDEDVLDEDVDDFALVTGDFQATRLVFVSVLDVDVRRDLIASGTAATILIDSRGNFDSTVIDTRTGATFTRTGTVILDDGDDALFFSDDPFIDDTAVRLTRFGFERTGDRLTLASTGNRFDFDGDGIVEDARFEGDFVVF